MDILTSSGCAWRGPSERTVLSSKALLEDVSSAVNFILRHQACCAGRSVLNLKQTLTTHPVCARATGVDWA